MKINKIKYVIIILALAITAFYFTGCSGSTSTAAPAPAETVETDNGDYVPGEVVVRLKPGTSAKSIAALVSGTVLQQYSIAGMPFVRIAPGGITVEKALEILSEATGIDYAQPNYIYHANLVPDDPEYAPRQYCHQRMNSEDAWDVTTGSSSVTVAIVDSGIDGTHVEFSGRTVGGYDFIDNKPLLGTENSDGAGHGTHVAGIVGATGNNSTGVAGINWQCKLMPVRVLNDSGSGSDTGVASGIQYAVDNGAKVINMSLGGPGYSQQIQDAINNANDNGVLVVVSMGNDYMRYISYPAASQGVIAVGSTDGNDQVSNYSTRGDHISVSAPGSNVYSTYTGLTPPYSTLSGTSMASPQVAGLASLIIGLNPGWMPTRVRSVIEATADDIDETGFDINSGYGRINCANAVNSTAADYYGAMAITVRDAGTPQSGVDVVIRTAIGDEVATTKTDTNGVAEFNFLHTGAYTASANYGGTTNETGTLTVSASATISTDIDF